MKLQERKDKIAGKAGYVQDSLQDVVELSGDPEVHRLTYQVRATRKVWGSDQVEEYTADIVERWKVHSPGTDQEAIESMGV